MMCFIKVGIGWNKSKHASSEDWIFQQDYAPCDTARSIKVLLEDLMIKTQDQDPVQICRPEPYWKPVKSNWKPVKCEWMCVLYIFSACHPSLTFVPSQSLVITEDSEASLRAILTHSLFKSESELKEQLDSIPGKKGTKILIWNIRR